MNVLKSCLWIILQEELFYEIHDPIFTLYILFSQLFSTKLKPATLSEWGILLSKGKNPEIILEFVIAP